MTARARARRLGTGPRLDEAGDGDHEEMDGEVHPDRPLSRLHPRGPHPDQLKGTRDEKGEVFLVVDDEDAGTVGPQDRAKDLAITSDSDVIVAWSNVALAPLSRTLIQPASTATTVPLSYRSERSRENDSSTGAACPSAVKRQDLMPPAVPKGDGQPTLTARRMAVKRARIFGRQSGSRQSVGAERRAAT